MPKIYWRGNGDHEYKRIALRRGEEDWKRQLLADGDQAVTEVFIIESSWYIDGTDAEGHANLTVWLTEEDAKDELDRLARNQGITIGPDDTAFEDGDDVYFINRYEIEGI